MITSIMNLIKENKDFGSIIKVWLLTSLVLIICTCSGQKSTSVNQTSENQTDYSTYSGKRVKQIQDATEYVTLKTDVRDSLSWRLEKQLI